MALLRIVAVLFLLTATASSAVEGNDQASVVVKFGSVCCGIDREAFERIAQVIAEREKTIGFSLRKRIIGGGLEGERTLCLMLSELRPSDRVSLIAEIKSVKSVQGTVKVEENALYKECWS